MQVADQAHAASFTRFIDSEDESEYDVSIGAAATVFGQAAAPSSTGQGAGTAA